MIKIFKEKSIEKIEEKVNVFLSVNSYKLIGHKLIVSDEEFIITLHLGERE